MEKFRWIDCPFCDAPVYVTETETVNTVECTICPCKMVYDGSLKALNAMWNNRDGRLAR